MRALTRDGHRRATPPRSTTCRCGTTSRCSTRSARSRRSGPTTISSPSTTTGTCIDGEYRQIMLSARELNSDSLPNRTLDQRAAHLHARLRPHARAGQPGDARRAAGAVRQGPAAGVDRRPRRSREPSIYFGELSNDHVFVRTQTHGVPLPEGRRQRLQRPTRATGGVPLDSLVPASCSSPSASGRPKMLLTRRHHAREPRDVLPPDRRARAADRAVPRSTTPTRTWRSRTGGCSGSRTPTPRASRYPYSTPARRTASTTSATR